MAILLFGSTSPASRHAARAFSTSGGARASILFQLGALSNARETQHFNKISKLDRYEHSPNLKLIKTSEIDPYPVPIEKLLHNAPPTETEPQLQAGATFRRATDALAWDAKALAAGRAILADTARERSQLARLMQRTRRRETRQSLLLQEHIDALAKERQRMREEMRSAGFLILLSVATATGFAMWTFWPAKPAADSAEIGRRIAEKAKASIPLPAISPANEVVAGAGAVPTTAVVTGEPTIAPALVLTEQPTARPATAWTWRNLFWRQ